MIGLLHVPLLLVPGLTFLAVALALRVEVSWRRLALGAVLVAVGVAVTQYAFSRVSVELGLHGMRRAMLLEFTASALMHTLAFRFIARLVLGRALLAALVAAGLDWLVSAIFAAGLGAGGKPAPL